MNCNWIKEEHKRPLIAIAIALVVVVIMVIVVLLILGLSSGDEKYRIGTEKNPKSFVDFPVDKNRCMLYDGKSIVYHPINYRFMVIGFEYDGGDNGMFLLSVMPKKRTLPGKASGTLVGGPVSDDDYSYDDMTEKGQFVLVEIRDLRKTAYSLFHDKEKGRVLWFRLDTIIDPGEVAYYNYDYDNKGHSPKFGIMCMQIREPKRAIFYHRDEKEYYPVGGYDSLFDITEKPTKELDTLFRSLNIPGIKMPAPSQTDPNRPQATSPPVN